MKAVLAILFLAGGCGPLRPEGGLCDIPAIVPQRSVPAPVPWHLYDGCWYVGVKMDT